MANPSPPPRGSWAASLWSRLTTPSAAITEPYRRRQARLLAIYHLIVIPFAAIIAYFPIFNETAAPTLAALIIIFILTYILSRTNYYEWGAGILGFVSSGFVFIALLQGISNIGHEMLYFITAVVLAFSLFFSLRWTLVFGVINIVAILALPALFSTDITLEPVIAPAILLVISLLIIWVLSRQRDLLEAERHEALAVSQEQLRLITNNLNDIVSHLDARGIIRFMSPSLQKVLGYPAETAIGQHYDVWVERVHPDDKPRVIETLESLMRGGTPTMYPYRIRHANGEYLWMEPVATSVAVPDGSPAGMILVTRDVTNRMVAEEALRASEAKFRALSDTIDAGVIIFRGDKAIFANPAAERLLGYTFAEFQAHNLLDVIHPMHRDMVEERLRARSQGETGLIRYELRILHKDGQPRWFYISAVEIEYDGSLSIIVTFFDITERKQAEEARQASETRFRAVADTVDAGILITRGDEVLYANPAAEEWFGYSFDELKSVDRIALIHPDSMSDMLALSEARQRGETGLRRHEVKVFHKDGGIRWIFMSTLIIEYEGAPSTISTFFDITQRRQEEQQRLDLSLEREKVRLLQQLIGDLTHDLGNPLATINTSLYLLNKAATLEKRQQHTNTITAQMNHLDKVLQDLKSIMRLEKDGRAMELKPLAINPLIENMAKVYEPMAAAKHQTFTYSLVPETLQVMGDSQQLSQALSNIVVNALAFTPEGGQITIQTQSDPEWVEIVVRDTGIGIQPDDLPHIFNHFYRGDKARSTDTGGTGLGLTIARHIILSHRGKIHVESEAGGGSTVSIALPVARSEE